MIDSEYLKKIVKEQAEDESLWFIPSLITEDILQRALRRLHAVIEGYMALADILPSPEVKYKIGDEAWTYAHGQIKDWAVDDIHWCSDNNDFRVGLINKSARGKGSFLQSELYPTKSELIEAQIEYWCSQKEYEPAFEGEIKGFNHSENNLEKVECEHQSDSKLYKYSEYCVNPPVFKCLKCEEFYR